MKKPNLFRLLGGLALVAGLALAATSLTPTGPRAAENAKGPAAPAPLKDRALGKPDAPVTIIEYASLTCHHCANFHKNVWPGLVERFIDSGKARIVLRDYPLDVIALEAAKLTRCHDEDRYFGFVKFLLSDQENWAFKPSPKEAIDALKQRARLAGMSAEKIDACLKNKPLEDAILNRVLEAQAAYGEFGTPTLIINGRKYTGMMSVDEIGRLIDQNSRRPRTDTSK